MGSSPSTATAQGAVQYGMLDLHTIRIQELQALSSTELTELASQMLIHISEQAKQIEAQAEAIRLRDAKIESITLQLAQLKAWRFGTKTERMSPQHRTVFEETCAADQASLETQLAALQDSPQPIASPKEPGSGPKRKALPAHLPRVEQRIEPEDTHCPTPECGQPMVRVGEDISERLDIIPAQFFVQRQIRGKWACKCCQLLVQEPAAPQVFGNALPTPGLQAHTVVSRFVDHLPYYRQEQINARAGVHTPRSTLAAWSGHTGAQLMPLYEAHRDFVRSASVMHADETPISLLDPGAGKTKKATMWAYARAAFDPQPGVVFDFCLGRGGQYPMKFLKDWSGTLVVDAYAGYDGALSLEGRHTAYCFAHARRKFDELVKANASPVALEAIQRMAWLYKIEADARGLSSRERWQMRQDSSKPLWEALHAWLTLERARVPDGSAIAKAIDYSLNHWVGLGRFLLDGEVPLDNNYCENQMRPWALGRKNWLFIGSPLAGERAAVVSSLLHSAKLNGHEPWAYLRDILTRMPTQPKSRLDELLPHRWQPLS